MIAGSGPSLAAMVRQSIPFCQVIAVNGAVHQVQADHWFTLDPSTANRDRMRRPIPGVRYWAAVPPDYGTPSAQTAEMRTPADAHVTYLQRLVGDGTLGSRPGLSSDPGAIHTGNSAYGALGLAYLMGARRIVLVGVDGAGGYHGAAGAPRDLRHLPDLFASAVPQLASAGVQVVNASMESTIQCFPKMRFKEALRWMWQTASA